MIKFTDGLDKRAWAAATPEVALFQIYGITVGYIIIGTTYGYIHKTDGCIRIWKTASGAYRHLKKYKDYMKGYYVP